MTLFKLTATLNHVQWALFEFDLSILGLKPDVCDEAADSVRATGEVSPDSPRSRVPDAAKAQVPGGTVRRVARARSVSVPVAVRDVAQVRAALHHA